jgi:hypothetical protein
MRKLFLLVLCLGLLVVAAPSLAEINITTNTYMQIHDSPYDIFDTIIVHPGSILTIDPGVVVIGAEIYVQGVLYAVGAPDNHIVLINCLLITSGRTIVEYIDFETK